MKSALKWKKPALWAFPQTPAVGVVTQRWGAVITIALIGNSKHVVPDHCTDSIDVPCLVFELHDDEWRKARQTALLSFCTWVNSLRKLNWCDPGHTASEWYRWSSKLGILITSLFFSLLQGWFQHTACPLQPLGRFQSVWLEWRPEAGNLRLTLYHGFTQG